MLGVKSHTVTFTHLIRQNATVDSVLVIRIPIITHYLFRVAGLPVRSCLNIELDIGTGIFN